MVGSRCERAIASEFCCTVTSVAACCTAARLATAVSPSSPSSAAKRATGTARVVLQRVVRARGASAGMSSSRRSRV